ncbi:hypothetical protein [Saccharopolyspora cebuensis]|uniref:Uncharacterized protein n=1 Tax=Saccharopolyspora cebuensis TaxID=418759 RepID=A0ABV4CJW0_9PSEU
MTAGPVPSHDDEVEVTLSDLKATPGKFARMAQDGYRVYVTECGTRLAALLSTDAADHIAEEEDAYWSRRAWEAEPSGTVSWEEAIRELEGGRG